MEVSTKKITVTSYGKGGTTSSGNWHVHYTKEATGYNGYRYTQELSKSFFTKSGMNQWLEANG